MKKNEIIKWALCVPVFFLLLLAGGCEKKTTGPDLDPTQTRNAFAQQLMTDLYLWSAQTQALIDAQRLDYTTETDPIAFFNKLKYSADPWSRMTDDLRAMEGDFSGTTTSFGYQLQFGRFAGTNDVFAIVAYVYPGTPAAAAGIERGDIIIGSNGGQLTTDNYRDLYNRSSNQLIMGQYDPEQDGIGNSGRIVSLTAAANVYQNPIQHAEVLTEHGRKIGYLCYTQYICDPANDAHGDLLQVFQDFKNAGVEDVVLDLRYNGGGYDLTAELLSNILAPRSALDNRDILTLEIWNADYSRENNYTTFGHELKYEWTDGKVYTDPVVNMDLSRVYILTSGSTASASESTIVGLMPYMDVVLVGGTTAGKFCGGLLLDRDFYLDWYKKSDPAHALDNWGVYMMVYQFTNKLGTTFSDGFTPQPDNVVQEDLLRDVYPFGDTRDPLLGRALELITGEEYTDPSTVTRSTDSRFEMIPTPGNALDGKLIKVRPENLRR